MIHAANITARLTCKGFDLQDQFLIAVSGGVDSMVLFSLCVDAKLNIQVAHVNYGLRGEESDKDEMLVRDFCAENGIKCHVSKFANNQNEKGSLQLRCRNHRYGFFEKLMKLEGLRATMTAHHRDDSVETILLNLFNGTGIDGLVGIPEYRDEYIRPLIGESRTEIVEYARKNSIEYRDDQSNFESNYDRNFIRNEIIPVISKRFSQATTGILKTSQNLSSAKTVLQEASKEHRENFLSTDGVTTRIHLDQLKEQNGHPFLIYMWLKEFGFNATQVSNVLEADQSGASFKSETHQMVYNRGEIVVEPLIAKSELESTFDLDGPIAGFEVEIREKEANWIAEGGKSVSEFDYDKLDVTHLRIRNWRSGDRFKPLGMNGWKKLSDLFVDEKLSVLEKEKVQILTSAEEIVWVVGIRPDDRFKVNKDTRTVLKLKYQP